MSGYAEVVSADMLVVGAGVGGGIAVGAGAWAVIDENRLPWLAGLFWLIFLFWQMFPVMATALTQNVDASVLLRAGARDCFSGSSSRAGLSCPGRS